MTWITRSRRARRRGLSAGLAPLVLPVLLLAACGSDDHGGAGTPTPTRPAATATATAPAATATATVPAPTATATAPGATATPMRTPTATATAGNGNASAACEKLVACGQCFADFTGTCISTAACAARLSADVATCINGVGGCNQTALGDCLFLGCDGSDPSGDCQ